MPFPKDEKGAADTEASTAVVSNDPTSDPTLPTLPTPHGDTRGDLRGEAISRYLLGEPIGEGGMGVVYSAYDPQLDRALAVKLVRVEGEDARGRAELRARLLLEARAMARLSHPNVVAVYDAGEWKDQVFLAMELVRGATTLKSWLRAGSRSWRDVLRIFAGAGRGIAAAHAAGIIHRDVKPENILLDADGRARITDFGIARAEDVIEPVSVGGVESNDLTRAGRVVGTPAYMAPEVLFGWPATVQSDEFSFCVALHAALYGKPPYPDNRIREGARVTVVDPPAGTRVPPRVRAAVLRGLALRPGDRFASMNDLLDELDRASSRGRLGAILAAGVVVTALVAMAVAPRGRDTSLCASTRPLAGVWDSGARTSIEHAFLSVDPASGDAWKRARSGLESVAGDWQSAVGRACAVPAEEPRVLRLSCLDKQRDRLRLLTNLLRSPDADVIAHASMAAATLPRAAECENVRRVQLAARLPDDGATRREIATMELRLAEATVQAGAGKYAIAVASMNAIAARAGNIGYRPLEAEALFALGQTQDDAGEAAASIETMTRAELAAEAAGDDRLAARAAAKLAYDANLTNHMKDRDQWRARARAVAERLGSDDLADGDIAFAEAWAAYDDGRREESLADARRAVELRTRALGPAHPDTLRASGALSVALTMLGRFDESLAIDQANIRLLDASLGLSHPGALRTLNGGVMLLTRLGRYEEADAGLARSIALAESIQGNTAPRAVTYLAGALLRLREKRLDDARAFARRAEDAARGSTGERSGNFLASLGLEGEIRLAQHDIPGALSALSRVIETGGDDDGETSAVYGEALLAAGKTREALREFERANASIPHQLQYPGTAARIRFDLARAIEKTGGDRARAHSLAQAARDELAPLAWQRDRLDEVDRWLARAK